MAIIAQASTHLASISANTAPLAPLPEWMARTREAVSEVLWRMGPETEGGGSRVYDEAMGLD